jgi:isopentenyl diphosphate isomerase/L-lactate dehydrogenase-like FMN-dependent dehydrogenase
MSRMSLLGGMTAVLVAAGATTLALKLTKPVVAQQHTDAAVPIDPAILNKHLRSLREEMMVP